MRGRMVSNATGRSAWAEAQDPGAPGDVDLTTRPMGSYERVLSKEDVLSDLHFSRMVLADKWGVYLERARIRSFHQSYGLS